ncbi:WG repeat-containing protein [Pedobacter agri]|uniref:WG repeat-containing protein n=1 Tax=Pedobacter agri TaxID=454586 RepID=UPI00292E6D80|nr:WG repeat-containing protein [Pedobacter agri]
MMKFQKYLILSVVVCFSSCMAQSKKDLLEKIDDDINGLKTIIKISETRIMISAATTEPFSADKQSNFESDNTKKVSDSVLNKFFTNRSVNNSLLYPYNIIALDKDEYDLLELMGEESSYFMHNADMEPVYTPQKFVFLDGTETNKGFLTRDSIAKKHTKIEKDKGEDYEFVDEEGMNELEKYIWKASSFNDNIAVLSPKPIKSIQFKISLPLASKTLYKVSVASPEVKTPYGIIRLDTIVGNQVHCSLPDVENDRDIKIQAYYKDGRVLSQKGSSSNTEITPAKKKLYEDYIKILDKAKEQVKADAIKTEKDLEKWLKSNAPAALADVDKGNRKKVIYTFAGPVSSVGFSVSDSLPQMRNFNATYNLDYDEKDGGYFLAMDFAKEKAGFINKEGKWVIQPQFNKHFRKLNQYFYWDQYDNVDNTYRINYKSQKVEKVPYKIDESQVYDGKYVKIEPRVNGDNGVVNAITGQIVLPMEYDNVKFKNGKYWWVVKNGKEGIFDRNFKVVLPLKYDDIDVEGDYFKVKENDQVNIFDAGGKNLTQNRYTNIEGTFHDGLLLIRRMQDKNKHVVSGYVYVDKLNQVKINATAKGYEDPEPFSEGLALVENAKGDKGFINTAGNLAIPFKFKYAYSFYPTSKLALVQLQNESYALINKKGVVVKELYGEYYDQDYDEDTNSWKIKVKGGVVYNEFGKELKGADKY